MGIYIKDMGCHKPRGINAGRKLRVHRRLQLWADLGYKKQNSGSKWKKPFMEASHAAGIVVEKVGGMSFIDENNEVLVAGFGRSGHSKGDFPGVRFKIVKVAGCGLHALWTHKKEKPMA